MTVRAYLSNIRSRWPIARQEALLDAQTPGWRSGQMFRDVVAPRKRRGHSADELVERASLLRPTGRRTGETIVVASLSVLAWTTADLFGVVSALTGRGATLRSLAEGVTITPDAQASALSALAETFLGSLRRATGEGPDKGGRISGERRKADAFARCQTIKERWAMALEDHPTIPLLAEAKVCRATAKAHLGTRKNAHKALLKRLAKAANGANGANGANHAG